MKMPEKACVILLEPNPRVNAASSEWKSPKGKGFYKLPKAGTEYTSSELIAHWKSLVEKYPIISIEDGLDEEDRD